MENFDPILLDFVQTEFFSEDARCAILNFVLNVNIRAGEYEGNIFIIKKLDTSTILLFREFIFPDTHIERENYVMFTVDDFISSISAITGKTAIELRRQGTK